jgi:hypothetical protein
MSQTGREIPTGLSEFHVIRLFKCALKDDDTLVDAIVEKLYGTMKDFDAERAKQTVEPPQSLEHCSTIYCRAAFLTWPRNATNHKIREAMGYGTVAAPNTAAERGIALPPEASEMCPFVAQQLPPEE